MSYANVLNIPLYQIFQKYPRAKHLDYFTLLRI